MSFSPPQRPTGTVQAQLEAMYSYLYRMAEALNLSLQKLDRREITVSSSGKALEAEAAALKQLIVKNAQIVRREMDTLAATLKGEYVAVSDFGTYIQKLSSQLGADPSGIDQYYSFFSAIQADLKNADTAFQDYVTKTEGFIRTGIVYYEGETPVFGVAVGQGLTSTEVDGGTEISSSEFRSVFTARKLGFFRGDQEVAYLSNDRLYITDITILHALQFGASQAEQWELGVKDGGFYVRWIGS